MTRPDEPSMERCKKVPHTGEGYLHAEDDDSPYLIDGVKYCGRCHRYGCNGWRGTGRLDAAEKENDPK